MPLDLLTRAEPAHQSTPPTQEPDPDAWDAPENCIIPEQPETFVYLNHEGSIVIRQRAAVFDDDPFIIIRPASALTLCRAILDAAEAAGLTAADLEDRP